MGGRREEYVLRGVLSMYIGTCSGREGRGWVDCMHGGRFHRVPSTVYVRYVCTSRYAAMFYLSTYNPLHPKRGVPSNESPPTQHIVKYLPTYLTSLHLHLHTNHTPSSEPNQQPTYVLPYIHKHTLSKPTKSYRLCTYVDMKIPPPACLSEAPHYHTHTTH